MTPPYRLEQTQQINKSLVEVFAFFSDASNLEALTPSFLRFRILTPGVIEMRTGACIDYSLSLFGIPVRWRTRITDWVPGVRFVDEQERGPFAIWRHTHAFEAVGKAVLMRDTVEYAPPFGLLGRVAHFLFVKRMVNRIFAFRREAIRNLLESEETTQRVAPGSTSAA